MNQARRAGICTAYLDSCLLFQSQTWRDFGESRVEVVASEAKQSFQSMILLWVATAATPPRENG